MREVIGGFSSTTLAGDGLAVPDDLTGPTLLAFAYRQHQQRDVDAWAALLPADGRVALLEVPLLGRKWLPARGVINGGMASNMDAQTRRQTLCVYTDVARFQREVLGVTSREVLAALVSSAGRVAWHAFGSPRPDDREALHRAIDELA